ncbi:unnamed protein product [Ixodes hexagonus]
MSPRRTVRVILLPVLAVAAFGQVLKTNHPPPFSFNSGVVRLIVKSFTDELIRDLGSSSLLQLTDPQAQFLRQRLDKLYEHVRRHPALHQRYLWVGKDRPNISPDETPAARRKQSKRSKVPEVSGPPPRGVKRNPPDIALAPLSEEICRTNTAWERMNKTVDSFGNAVEVVQDEAFPQWVFAYRCATQGTTCVGIDALYDSECTERPGFMILYHRKIGTEDNTPSWGAVEVPHHCTCKITPKVLAEAR